MDQFQYLFNKLSELYTPPILLALIGSAFIALRLLVIAWKPEPIEDITTWSLFIQLIIACVVLNAGVLILMIEASTGAAEMNWAVKRTRQWQLKQALRKAHEQYEKKELVGHIDSQLLEVVDQTLGYYESLDLGYSFALFVKGGGFNSIVVNNKAVGVILVFILTNALAIIEKIWVDYWKF